MKLFSYLVILLSIIVSINSTCQYDDDVTEPSRVRYNSDCYKRTFSSEEQSANYYDCCLLEREIDEPSRRGREFRCIHLSRSEFDNIKSTVSKFTVSGVESVSIDCNSSYLKFALLSLILLFF